MRLVAATLLAIAHIARADPLLAALAPDRDALRAVALGPSGEVYEPDGAGAWIRHHDGGIARTVTSATWGPIAGVADGPPFRFTAGAWSAIYVGSHAKAVLGAGSRPVAAVGRNVLALDRATPTKLADAPALVIALAASPAGVVIETDRGLARLANRAWKPIQGAPQHVIALVSHRWALGDHGAIDLRAVTTIAWPTRVRVEIATAVGDDLVAAATDGAAIELFTIHAGAVAREAVAIDHAPAVVGIAADRAGRVVIALHDGRLAVRVRGTWTVTTVRYEPPVARAGSPPAMSK